MKKSNVAVKNFFTVDDLTESDIRNIFSLADEMAEFAEGRGIPNFAPKRRLPSALRGRAEPLPFEAIVEMQEPSTRTAQTMITAAKNLGCSSRQIPSKESTSLAKGEGPAHNTMMLAGVQRADIYALRTTAEGSARYAAEVAARYQPTTNSSEPREVAVIGLGDGCHGHVTQGLGDGYHLYRRFGGLLDKVVLGIVGGIHLSRTGTELCRLARMTGMKVMLFCKEQHLPSSKVLDGVDYSWCHEENDNWKGIKDCDAINWIRPQDERSLDPMAFMRIMEYYRFTTEVRQECKPGVIHLHAQPIKDQDDLLPVYPGMYHLDAFRSIQEQALSMIQVRMAIIQTCLENLDQPTLIPEPTKIELVPASDIKQTNLTLKHQDMMAQADLENFAYRPIKNGTVIDHLSVLDAIALYLWLIKQRKIDLSAGGMKFPAVPLFGESGKSKGQLVAEHVFFASEEILAILLTYDGSTFNVCRQELDLFFKFRNQFPQKEMILTPDGILPCPSPACITNLCAQAQTGFYVNLKSGDNPSPQFTCRFCERIFSAEEIRRKIRQVVGPLRIPGS